MLRLHWQLVAALAVAGLAVLVLAWLAAANGRAYLVGEARLARLHDAEAAVLALQVAIQGAESDQRGYLLGGGPGFLEAFQASIAKARRRLDVPLVGVAGLPEAERLAAEIAAQGRRRLDELVASADAPVIPADPGVAASLAQSRADMAVLQQRIARLRSMLAAESAVEAGRVREHTEDTLRVVLMLGIAILAAIAIAYVLLTRQIEARRRMAATLREQANHDSLTGLPNRRFFDTWLGFALAQARRDGTHLAVLYIDLDGFKRINDAQGHKAGDAMLVEIARRFRTVTRESDVLARLGGDEFALAAPNARDGRRIAGLAQRIIESLTQPPLPVGASVGVAFFPDDAVDARSLVAAADSAMYSAKRNGRNRFAFAATAGADEAVAPTVSRAPGADSSSGRVVPIRKAR